MNRFLVGSAVSATLALSGMAAHASCVDPRASSPQVAPFVNRHHPGAPFGGRNAAENIVGTWDVVYTTNPSSAPSGEAFIQWHSDGTEWENINYPVLGGNICMGFLEGCRRLAHLPQSLRLALQRRRSGGLVQRGRDR